VPPANVSLAPDELHLWRASLDVAPDTLLRLGELLSDDDRIRADRLRFDQEGRRRFVAARGILRDILARYAGRHGRDLMFIYSNRSRPELIADRQQRTIAFNMSNSRGLALYAVTGMRAVGVDIQAIRRVEQYERVAERRFAGDELRMLREAADDERPSRFFDLWARKEAHAKASGSAVLTIGGTAEWATLAVRPFPDATAAVAVPARPSQVGFWAWTDDAGLTPRQRQAG
jgi:4'-phosphopantetheinyl transferase